MTFKPPQSGELNHMADVQQFQRTGTDANGQAVGTWVTFTLAYVKLEPLSGRILEIARQLFETASHNIYLRYNRDVNRSCRIVIGGAVYAIGWVDVQGVEWLRVTAEETWPSDDLDPSPWKLLQETEERGTIVLEDDSGSLGLESL